MNTAKAKLRGANYPREKSKTSVLLTELQSCKRAKLLLTEMHTPYIVCVCVHTAVVGRTTVTRRGQRGHTHESQAVAQLLQGEVTGVTQRKENNRINIHHNNKG